MVYSYTWFIRIHNMIHGWQSSAGGCIGFLDTYKIDSTVISISTWEKPSYTDTSPFSLELVSKGPIGVNNANSCCYECTQIDVEHWARIVLYWCQLPMVPVGTIGVERQLALLFCGANWCHDSNIWAPNMKCRFLPKSANILLPPISELALIWTVGDGQIGAKKNGIR